MVPAMSVPPRPPAGAVRLGQVAGVPVYLDRTWLFLAAFIAWTGWQAGRDLGTGGALAYAAWLVRGILLAVLGHEVARALSARLLGFRVHRIVATLWGGHTAYDGTGTTPGRAAVIAVSGPVANLALAAVGAVAGIRVRLVLRRPQHAPCRLQPPARASARRRPARGVARLERHRPAGPRPRRRRLVRAPARHRPGPVVRRAAPRPHQPATTRPRSRRPVT